MWFIVVWFIFVQVWNFTFRFPRQTALPCPVRRGLRQLRAPRIYLPCGRPVEKEAAARNQLLEGDILSIKRQSIYHSPYDTCAHGIMVVLFITRTTSSRHCIRLPWFLARASHRGNGVFLRATATIKRSAATSLGFRPQRKTWIQWSAHAIKGRIRTKVYLNSLLLEYGAVLYTETNAHYGREKHTKKPKTKVKTTERERLCEDKSNERRGNSDQNCDRDINIQNNFFSFFFFQSKQWNILR